MEIKFLKYRFLEVKDNLAINLNKTMVLSVVLFGALSSYGQVDPDKGTVNLGHFSVLEGTDVVVISDFKNANGGTLVNDGSLNLKQNWTDDGATGFDPAKDGEVRFNGAYDQFLESSIGGHVSNFNNVYFDNTSNAVPFNLGTTLDISKSAYFDNGVIEAKPFGGEVVFGEGASSENAKDESFVRGTVVKRGDSNFEFPVGDNLYYRPIFQSPDNNVSLRTEFFAQNSLNRGTDKEEGIVYIDDKEYWTIEDGNGNNILSLTLDSDTSPAVLFDPEDGYELAIVRWDEDKKMWVSEGGVTTDSHAGVYEKLVMAEVSDYGVFTFGIVKEKEVEKEFEIYNAISPNGDGKNEFFYIRGIDNYPENHVEIYNRWGVLVFETDGYNESDNVFRGYSEGRVTIAKDNQLPEGTYFYIVNYKKDTDTITESGFLYIQKD